MSDHPETVTLHDIPWEAAKAIATAKHSVVLADAAWPVIEACREATKPKPRYVVSPRTNVWVIRDTTVPALNVADFHKGLFTEGDVQAIADKLNEGEK